MPRLTSPEKLEALAALLDQEAARLHRVLAELRQQVEQTRGNWESKVADRFRSHVGPEHRQHHLRVARDRLRHAARLARLAAADNRTRGGAVPVTTISPVVTTGGTSDRGASDRGVSGGGEG